MVLNHDVQNSNEDSLHLSRGAPPDLKMGRLETRPLGVRPYSLLGDLKVQHMVENVSHVDDSDLEDRPVDHWDHSFHYCGDEAEDIACPR